MDERRKWPRAACKLPCLYETDPGDGHLSDESHSRALLQDISEGGVRIQIFQFLSVGKKIHIYLEIPYAEPIETQLEIVRVSEVPRSEQRFEAGARFTSLAEDQSAEIRRYVQAHLQKGTGHYFFP